MIVTCPNCATKYKFPDDKIAPGGTKVKCSSCSHVFKVAPPKAAQEAPQPEPVAPPEPQPAAPEPQSRPDAPEMMATAPETEAAPPDDEFDDLFGDEQPSGATAPEKDAESPADEFDDLFADEPEPAAAESASAPAGDEFDDLFADVAQEEDAASRSTESDDLDSLFDDLSSGEEKPTPATEDFGSLFDDEESGGDDIFAAEEPATPPPGGSIFEDEETDSEPNGRKDEEDEMPTPGHGPNLDFGTADSVSLDAPKKKSGGKKTAVVVAVTLALLVAAAFAVYHFQFYKMVPFLAGGDMKPEESAPSVAPEDKFKNLVFDAYRQYYVTNEKAGMLFVVEGKVTNNFQEPKERITVEAKLFDAQGKELDSLRLVCGNSLSNFQLQVQSREEIEAALTSEVGILANNTFVRPGASVPFTFVFFNPPASVKEYALNFVDVSDPQ